MAPEHCFRKHQQGTTLIELVMTIVIISVAMRVWWVRFLLLLGAVAEST